MDTIIDKMRQYVTSKEYRANSAWNDLQELESVLHSTDRSSTVYDSRYRAWLDKCAWVNECNAALSAARDMLSLMLTGNTQD